MNDYMFFTKRNLIEIFETNFGYNIIQDEIFGDVLEVDARTAYRFCLTTNSHYLVDKYGFSLFGRFRTFNHRDFSLIPGLFDINPQTHEISDRNFPHKIYEKYPFIFNGDKKVIFVESHEISRNTAEIYNKIIRANKKTDDYIVNFVHRDGSQWEHYFEFMASEIFIKKGYFTDIQLPWTYHGRPDFGAYKHHLVRILNEMDIIENGALILELSALRLFREMHNTSNNNDGENNNNYEFLVGEVKSTQKNSQILKYLMTGLCFKGYEFIPNKKRREEFCGLIKINQDNRIIIEEGPISEYMDFKKIKTDLEWFDSYLKINLLGNLTLSELKKLMVEYIGSEELTFYNLINLVKEKINTIKLLEIVKNGI